MLKLKKAIAFLSVITTSVSACVIAVPSVTMAESDSSQVKIMSLGDSITDGYWTSGGYRKYLCHELEQMGYNNIDMVGAKGGNSSTFNYNGETVKYDDNYSGYSGYAIQKMTTKENREGILETIQGTWYNGKNMIQAYDPDIVLLQIGTNDILSEYNDGITDRLENLVNVILEDMDADDVVYVSTIPDIDAVMRADWLGAYGINAWGSTAEEKQQLMNTVQSCIDSYNSSIYDMVERMQGEGKQVRFADIHSVVDYKTDLYDGVHPNEQGYENMGKYWAGVLDDYFQNGDTDIIPVKPVTTATTTTTSTTTTTTTAKPVTTTTKQQTEAPVTTTTSKVTVPNGAKEVHLSDFKIGETYDISEYSDVSAVSFVFSGSMQYGINGCASFGNWTLQKNYTQDDIKDGVLTVALGKSYNDMVLYKWYGEAELSDIILYCDKSEITTATTTTTAKPTTTTTTTTTAKPTTTTTTTTTAKPTTTTTTTTTAKPTTTTTTTTTAKPTTTTTTTESAGNTVVFNNVESGKEYSLAKYNPSAIKEIVIQLEGEVGCGFGGKLVLGNWTVQKDFGMAEMKADKTITFKIDNPQDKMTIYNYWGNMKFKSVTLVY